MGRTRSSTPLAISDTVRAAYQEHLQTGAPIAMFCAQTGIKRSKLRRLFYQLAGSADDYKAKKPTRTSTPRIRKARASGKPSHEAPRPAFDDSILPFTISATREEGWGFEDRYDGAGIQYIVAHGPDGHSYVRARPNERADLLYLSSVLGIPNVRLRRLEDSSIERRASAHRDKSTKQRQAAATRRIEKRRTRKLRKRTRATRD